VTADGLTENDVIELLVRHLGNYGWTIQQALTTRQPGIDLVAKRREGALWRGKGRGEYNFAFASSRRVRLDMQCPSADQRYSKPKR
jgi:hypothetical protein